MACSWKSEGSFPVSLHVYMWSGGQTPQAFMALALSLAPTVSFVVVVSFAFLI